LNLPDVCIYSGSEDDELVLDTERSGEGKSIRPQCQSYVESGKPRVSYGKRAFDEGTGRNVRQRDSSSVGDRDGGRSVTAIPMMTKKKKMMMMMGDA
jgi:hypothetical protein